MSEQAFWETDPVLSALEPRAALSRETEELIERAKADPGAVFEPKTLEALAELKANEPAQYERARARLKDAGVRVGALDEELKKLARANGGNSAEPDHGQGQPLKLLEPEPWPEPVDGAALLDEIAKAFRTHLALPDRADVVLPLWGAHTYFLDLWDHTPRLGVTSPEMRCGKTTLLIILGLLVWRPLQASNITAAATFRAIAKAEPTLLIDEADIVLNDNEDLRCVELSSNVVDGGASGGVLNPGFAIDEPDAADDLGEPGWAVQAAPAPLGALAQPKDHRQGGLP